ALDLAERKRIAEDTAESIFVSIHMNTYPKADCTGLQVWYSPNDPASYVIAEQIQRTARTLLQPENNRKVKEATGSIYLLHHIQTPCVLVECGFLSSPEEAAMLNTPEYQKKLAFVLFCAIMQAENPFLET
ncbi:MAG: N-acetylmuramoyl-L-alanine amidase, partial [Clostridia bacterium]|nr:N-acetylmuramoyl-L-alanine amidase [Clostridia bacterium]